MSAPRTRIQRRARLIGGSKVIGAIIATLMETVVLGARALDDLAVIRLVEPLSAGPQPDLTEG